MNATHENLTDLNAVLTINLSNEDYLPKVESSLKKLGKNITLKGFRQGKVPSSVVKKMYGNQVLAEELDKLVNETINNYIKEADLQILGNPIPKDDAMGDQVIDINAPADFEFKYELGLTPQFEVNAFTNGAKMDKYTIKLSASEIDTELNGLRKRFGKHEHPDSEIEVEDVLGVTLEELDDKGKVKEGGISNETSIAVDLVKDNKIIDKLLKMKPGDDVNVDLLKTFDKEKQESAKHFLNYEGADWETLGESFKMTVNKIHRSLPGDLNQELFDQVFGKDVVASEQEFMEKLEEELNKAYNNQTKGKFSVDVMNFLIDDTTIELPEEFLKRWMLMSSKEPTNTDAVDAQYPDFARSLKWNLIVGKITKENNLTVEMEDVKQRTIENVKVQFAQMGGDLSEEEYESFAARMMGNEEHVQKTYETIMEEKLIDYISGALDVNEKEVSLEAFNELVKEGNN